jgi:hypothetical protein
MSRRLFYRVVMQYIVSNKGYPSPSRNASLKNGVWQTFDGLSYTCKIGNFVYDWVVESVSSGKVFLAAQSPKPTFTNKSYATGECDYFGIHFGTGEMIDVANSDGTTSKKKDESKLEPPPANYPDPCLFNANWQGVDGSMISWISNENNTGVSSSTFVMVGGKFYDLGKPILGAALNEGFILAIHCESGIAVFCEYSTKDSKNGSVTKRKEIEITKESANIPDMETLSKEDYLNTVMATNVKYLEKFYADRPYMIERFKDRYYSGYLAKLKEPPYFASAARASFSPDLSLVLLHTSYAENCVYQYSKIPLTNSSSMPTKQTDGFIVFSIESTFINEEEIKNAEKKGITPIPEKKFNYKLKHEFRRNLPVKNKEKSIDVPELNLYAWRTYLGSPMFSGIDVPLKSVLIDKYEVFLFAELVGNTPRWITADVDFSLDTLTDFYNGNIQFMFSKRLGIGGSVLLDSKAINTNRSDNLAEKMLLKWYSGDTSISGSSSAKIKFFTNTENNENKTFGEPIEFTSTLTELRFDGGNISDGIPFGMMDTGGSSGAGSAMDMIWGSGGAIPSGYIYPSTNRGAVKNFDGELSFPIIEVDYVDMRCDFIALSVVEHDAYYMFRDAPKNKKIHLRYLDKSKKIEHEKLGTFKVGNSDIEAIYKKYPAFYTKNGLKELFYDYGEDYIRTTFYVPSSGTTESTATVIKSKEKYNLLDIGVGLLGDYLGGYCFPAELYIKKPDDKIRIIGEFTYRHTSCAYDAINNKVVYYIKGGDVGTFYDGKLINSETKNPVVFNGGKWFDLLGTNTPDTTEDDSAIELSGNVLFEYQIGREVNFETKNKKEFIDNHQIAFYFIDMGG